MTAISINVRNRAGTIQGEGPITTAVEAEWTRRLNRAGSFRFRFPRRDERVELLSNKASIVEIKIDNGIEFWGIVEQMRTTIDNQNNIWLQVEGRDMLAELAEVPVGFLDVNAGSGGVYNGPARVLTAASQLTPVAWGLNTSQAYGTTKTAVYTRFAGESALQALVKIAEHIGERFRVSPSFRRILWLRDDVPTATVRAIQGVGDPVAAEGNSNICFIQSIEEIHDTYEFVNRIYPYGSGIGETRLTLRPSTRSVPIGWLVNRNENYLENLPSVNSLGTVIARHVQYKSLRPVSNTDADLVSSANALFDATLADLQRRQDVATSKTYSIEVARLPLTVEPGDRLQVLYNDTAYTISTTLFILEITTRIDSSGVLSHRLVVSTSDQYPVTDGELQAQRLEEGTVLSAHPQMNANSYRENHRVFIGEDQTSEKAEIRWWFGPEVVQLDQVLWRFNLTELVSPSSTVGGTVASTGSSSITTTASGGSSSPTSGTGDHTHPIDIPAGTIVADVGLNSSNNVVNDGSVVGSLVSLTESGGHSHTVSVPSHTHGMDHTHDIDVGAALSTEFGINRESAADTFVIADLEYRVNNGTWSSLDAANSLAGGWYALDLTNLLSTSNFRPLQEGNLLEVRRKAGGATGKTAMIDGALEIRNFIQSIAFR